MWIKSLSSDAWINLTHITHFKIEDSNAPVNSKPYDVVAYLDASHIGYSPREHEVVEGQAFVTVKHGTAKKCKWFIKRKLFWQSLSQWIGYLVAGGLGAVLTYLFQSLSKN